LSNAVDLNLELSATGLEGKFDGEHGGKPDYDGILGATLGVTYYFPTRGFQRPVPQIISELELRQMRDQMNAMAAANMQLQQQLANAQQPVVEEAEEVVVTDANIAPRTVFFKIRFRQIVSTRRNELVISCQQDERIPEHDLYNQRICRLCNRYAFYQPEVKSGTCTSCKGPVG